MSQQVTYRISRRFAVDPASRRSPLARVADMALGAHHVLLSAFLFIVIVTYSTNW